MDNTLSNSFFYFFSATPQVLGAIMALFAVFVIFKIQALKDEILSLAQYLHNTVDKINEKGDSLDMKKKRGKLSWEIKRHIEAKNIVQVYEAIKKYDELHTTNKIYKVRKKRFDDIYAIKENLVSNTIAASKITAFLIIFCLLALPFGKYVICHTVLLWIIFGLVLVWVGIVFNKVLTILKEAFA
jgi:hypothetical protein